MDAGLYANFVVQAAVQAREAHPGIMILAGLSTNPKGQDISAEQLRAAVHGVDAVVDGYWLNIPSGGRYCPTCGEPKPEVADALLKMLY